VYDKPGENKSSSLLMEKEEKKGKLIGQIKPLKYQLNKVECYKEEYEPQLARRALLEGGIKKKGVSF